MLMNRNPVIIYCGPAILGKVRRWDDHHRSRGVVCPDASKFLQYSVEDGSEIGIRIIMRIVMPVCDHPVSILLGGALYVVHEAETTHASTSRSLA